MDYLEIIIRGYSIENNREHFENYFFREFKKAEKKYFEVDEFFGGCLKVIESWEHDLDKQLNNRCIQLADMINAAENENAKYPDAQGKTIEQKKEAAGQYNIELSTISRNNFSVNLSESTNRGFTGNLSYNEVLFIKKTIEKAYQNTEKDNSEKKYSLQSIKIKKNKFKNMDSWVEWMCRNPELSEKYYPELTTGLKERIQQNPPYLTALIIQKLPEQFNKWKTDSDQLFSKTRQKKIKEYIYLLNNLLNVWQYSTEIEISAINEVRDELNEQLEYLEIELKAIPNKQKNKSTANGNSSLRHKVENSFSFMKDIDPRKHGQILDEGDFNDLIKWVTYYFENNFQLPEITKPIQKVNTNKGNVIFTFLKFFKEEHPEKTRPESLFKLIKACFKEYGNDNIDNFKKQSKPQYYDILISKNK